MLYLNILDSMRVFIFKKPKFVLWVRIGGYVLCFRTPYTTITDFSKENSLIITQYQIRKGWRRRLDNPGTPMQSRRHKEKQLPSADGPVPASLQVM